MRTLVSLKNQSVFKKEQSSPSKQISATPLRAAAMWNASYKPHKQEMRKRSDKSLLDQYRDLFQGKVGPSGCFAPMWSYWLTPPHLNWKSSSSYWGLTYNIIKSSYAWCSTPVFTPPNCSPWTASWFPTEKNTRQVGAMHALSVKSFN